MNRRSFLSALLAPLAAVPLLGINKRESSLDRVDVGSFDVDQFKQFDGIYAHEPIRIRAFGPRGEEYHMTVIETHYVGARPRYIP